MARSLRVRSPYKLIDQRHRLPRPSMSNNKYPTLGSRMQRNKMGPRSIRYTDTNINNAICTSVSHPVACGRSIGAVSRTAGCQPLPANNNPLIAHRREEADGGSVGCSGASG